MRRFTLSSLCLLVGLAGSAGAAKSSPAVDPAPESTAQSVPAAADDASTWSEGGTIPSGRAGVADIQILKVHALGKGKVCGEGKTATLKYVAMLRDGSVLDPGTRPFSFKVGYGRAIKGWDVVVSKMRVGDSFTVLLPQELAYGPAKGDLRFDMELLAFR